jgi:hypothetical protein
MKLIAQILFALMIFSSACSAQPAPNLATDLPGEPTKNEAYPAIETETNPYPLSAEEASGSTPGPAPTPAPDTGVVTGTILHNGKQIKRATIYLAEVLRDEQQLQSVAAFDPVNSPRAYLDPEGKFVFANIEPGEYNLVLDFVVSNLLLGHPDGSGPIFLMVEAGETVDLGTLDYPDLPEPSP